MGSVYKPKGSKTWMISWFDEQRRRRKKAAGRDRRVAMKELAEIEDAVAARTSGRYDRFERARAQPLEEHLAGFETMLVSRGVTADHVEQTMARLRKAFAWFGVATLEGIEFSKATAYLAHLRRDKKRSAKTCDDYGAHLKFFGQWLVNDGRLQENPFRLLRNTRTEADQTRRRQALNLAQLEQLAAAAVQRPLQEWRRTHPRGAPEPLEALRRAGERRSLLYWFAGLTGLRANECRQLTWADVELEGNPPTITVRAQYAKSRRSARLPLHRHLAKLLQAEQKQQAIELRRPVRPADAVLHVPRWLADQLRKDARWAEIKDVDDQGRVLDFHALRTSCATILASHGVAPSVAQRILRHSDPRITAKHYTKLALGELADALGSLPDPGSASGAEIGAAIAPDGASPGTPGQEQHDDGGAQADEQHAVG